MLRHARFSVVLTLMLVAASWVASAAFAQSGSSTSSSNASSSTPLKVATIERRPFSFKTSDGYAGFSIDLWNAIARERGWISTFVDSASFKDMLGSVETKTVDLAIANISITSAREQVLDFSQPVFDAGLQILVPADGGSGSVLSAIFTLDMLAWVVAAGALLFVVGNLMWFFEHRAQPYFDKPYREGMWPSFWWALNLLINGGFEERVPRSIPGRIFGTLLVVASLFIVSAFVAKITSALTVGQLRNEVQGVNDLYGKRVATTERSTAAAYLERNGVRFRTFASVDDAFKALEKKELDAVVHDAPIVSYYAANAGKGIARTIGAILQPEKYGIALPQNSALTEDINLALLRLREDGTYARLVKRWFGAAYE